MEMTSPSIPKFYILNGMGLRLGMAFPIVSLLFQVVEYDRPFLKSFSFLRENFIFLLLQQHWSIYMYMYTGSEI